MTDRKLFGWKFENVTGTVMPIASQKLLHHIGGEVIGQNGNDYAGHDPIQSPGKEPHKGEEKYGENHTHGEGFMAFIKAHALCTRKGVDEGQVRRRSHDSSIVQSRGTDARKGSALRCVSGGLDEAVQKYREARCSGESGDMQCEWRDLTPSA